MSPLFAVDGRLAGVGKVPFTRDILSTNFSMPSNMVSFGSGVALNFQPVCGCGSMVGTGSTLFPSHDTI